jgi:hypothetical protein
MQLGRERESLTTPVATRECCVAAYVISRQMQTRCDVQLPPAVDAEDHRLFVTLSEFTHCPEPCDPPEVAKARTLPVSLTRSPLPTTHHNDLRATEQRVLTRIQKPEA